MRPKSLNPDEYLKRLHEERAHAINKDIDERQQTVDDFAAYRLFNNVSAQEMVFLTILFLIAYA